VVHHPEETQQPQHTQAKLKHQHKRKNPPHQLPTTQSKQAMKNKILKTNYNPTRSTLIDKTITERYPELPKPTQRKKVGV